MCIATLCAMIVPAFTSCEKDDNDDPDKPENPSTGGDSNDEKNPGEDVEGTPRIKFINGGIYVKYDDKGRVASVGYGVSDELFKIDYNSGKIILADRNNDGKSDGEYNVRFNADGFITSMTTTWDYDDEGDRKTGTGDMTFSYNGRKLVKTESNTDSSTEYEGKKDTTSKKLEETVKWEGDKITEVVRKTTTIRNDEDPSESESVRKFGYGSLKNKYRQWTVTMAYSIIDSSWMSVLALTGYFGDGPSILPDSCEVYGERAAIEYVLNADGTIASENIDGTTYTLTY